MRKLDADGVTEDQVGPWVEEGAAGYGAAMFRQRGRPGRGAKAARVVSVRLTEEELEMLMTRARREGLSQSQAIRVALTAWSAA